jgi:hypothetical protein
MDEVPSVLDGTLDTSAYTMEHVLDMNQRLAEYTKWWDLFDICVQVCNPAERLFRVTHIDRTGFNRFPLRPRPPMRQYISGDYSRNMR